MVDCGIIRLKLFWLKLDLLEAKEAQQVRQHLLKCDTCRCDYDATETESVEPVVRALIRERLVRRTMSKLVDTRMVPASDDNLIGAHAPLDSAESPGAPRLDSPLRLDGNRPARSIRRKLLTHVRLVAVVGGIAATIVIGMFMANLLHDRGALDETLTSARPVGDASIADIKERVAALLLHGQDSDAEVLLRSFIIAREGSPASRSAVAEARICLGSLLRDRAQDIVRRAQAAEHSTATHNRQLGADRLRAARANFQDAAQTLLQADASLRDETQLIAQLRQEMASLYASWRTVDPDVATDRIADDLRQRIEKGTGAPP